MFLFFYTSVTSNPVVENSFQKFCFQAMVNKSLTEKRPECQTKAHTLTWWDDNVSQIVREKQHLWRSQHWVRERERDRQRMREVKRNEVSLGYDTVTWEKYLPLTLSITAAFVPAEHSRRNAGSTKLSLHQSLTMTQRRPWMNLSRIEFYYFECDQELWGAF